MMSNIGEMLLTGLLIGLWGIIAIRLIHFLLNYDWQVRRVPWSRYDEEE